MRGNRWRPPGGEGESRWKLGPVKAFEGPDSSSSAFPPRCSPTHSRWPRGQTPGQRGWGEGRFGAVEQGGSAGTTCSGLVQVLPFENTGRSFSVTEQSEKHVCTARGHDHFSSVCLEYVFLGEGIPVLSLINTKLCRLCHIKYLN